MLATIQEAGFNLLTSILLKRDSTDADPDIPDDEVSDPTTEEIFTSWALFILIILLIGSLWTSYYLQQKRIQAVHETVISIFSGMVVGLIIRILPGHFIQEHVSFNYSYFFNLLLPPIILNSGYELHQANFFRNIGTILTFAFLGTFLGAIFLGVLLYLWTAIGLEGIQISFLDAISVGATLSATDPVTILSIFNAYKVDPKLYTIIFGESLLNDAVCIVMFETAQKFSGEETLHITSLFKGIGLFLMTFTISLMIGTIVEVELIFKPILIIVTTIGICISRWASVFPLSKLINMFYRRRRAQNSNSANTGNGSLNQQLQPYQDEIPPQYQMMLFWAGLRGAVGVALAAGLTGEHANSLKATVLVVVVLTVIVFGGTTARMLEILGIRTGVVEEAESDDEFDIEASLGMRYSTSQGHRSNRTRNSGFGSSDLGSYSLDNFAHSSSSRNSKSGVDVGSYDGGARVRRSSSYRDDSASGGDDDLVSDVESDASDLPPMANSSKNGNNGAAGFVSAGSHDGESSNNSGGLGARTLSGILTRSADDHARWFKEFDEQVLKPVLLDNLPGPSGSSGNSANNSSTSLNNGN
ncbi:uncharacterized protein SAPINGB_P001338 [Magnusiomyces paraingens]|uniref:Sodium/hydrogen exchanger n=1 Tax=Magnusiomyces paraingens TaxID=2606893 RepID=A0A5E8B7D3_9ASCO|nr:uncharacterized protein SAPINGB_P001338 [Saprochaete ingens]VVT46689.1 unnamed protein product [Saprochaete ingens]